MTPPPLNNIKVLTPLQLNAFRFSGKHTPLTPDRLDVLVHKKTP